MKQKQALSTMTGFLVVTAVLITGLASANIATDRENKSIMHAQKLDAKNDGAITLDELTALQDHRFVKLDRDENGVIEKHESNARLINMFHRMDLDGDGELWGYELPSHNYGEKQPKHGDKG